MSLFLERRVLTAFLAKATFTIGLLFVINTITLGYMYSQSAQASVVDEIVQDTNIPAPAVALQPSAAETNSTK
jgi:preprotein translocase subunit SecG